MTSMLWLFVGMLAVLFLLTLFYLYIFGMGWTSVFSAGVSAEVTIGFFFEYGSAGWFAKNPAEFLLFFTVYVALVAFMVLKILEYFSTKAPLKSR